MSNKNQIITAKPQFSLGTKTDEMTYLKFNRRAKSQKTTVSKILQNSFAQTIKEWENEENQNLQDGIADDKISFKTSHNFSSYTQSEAYPKYYFSDILNEKKALKLSYQRFKEVEMWGNVGQLVALIAFLITKK